ncbi:MAG: phosphatidyl-myo-inositol alpha-mannosyltransferase [Solirubrobacteraceae bacterium]|jgi:phosphatidylinositol alpha-mannosyltransferase|nr:phosphatidyl-myo-inositol alpha-mannosyltransferase [Solirubrobacteraceae bacterium]
MAGMRIALVSPYSWTYPGGVTRHIEALAGQFQAGGHDVRVFAPYDPPDRLSARLHRGARPEAREIPEWLVPLGRTVGIEANGAVSNLALTPYAVTTLRNELRAMRPDVIHVHEPPAPAIGYDALDATCAPLVGTFHAYSDNAISNGLGNAVFGVRRKLNRLRVRIAVSEAAAWTGRRFYGGRYRIIPNGVEVPPAVPVKPVAEGRPLRLAFVGLPVERKGLPVLLRAFEALREHLPAELILVGAGPDDVAPLMLDPRGVRALGKVSDERKHAALAAADLLVAPSLGGESFGMVLTEAFAAGTPVVASDIAGYRDVLRDHEDGVLVPRGDPTALAETLRDLALDPHRRARMAQSAAQHAQRYAWPTVAGEVLGAYEDAVAMPAPEGAADRAKVWLGSVPADLRPAVTPQRLPSIEPKPAAARSPLRRNLRRGAMGIAALAGGALSLVALQRIGMEQIGQSLVAATPWWVVVALGLMCLSMAVRAIAWHAILRAALPHVRLRPADALQGTFIGVLMSATLPARLGEPSRAFIVARRTGRPREHLPTVVGTIVSQTLLNVVALVVLGIVMFSTVSVFSERHRALVFVAVAPIAILIAVLVAPALLRGGMPTKRGAFGAGSRWLRRARSAAMQVRQGARVFRTPRLGLAAAVLQLSAWAIQWLSCYALLVALGLDHLAGAGAAAAVLFAVNVTAVLPATPSNLGVFQAACVAVLSSYGVGYADAIAYGIILQAVEIATAVVMGAPALLREGMSWRDVRLRAMHASPVELAPLPSTARGEARAGA